MLRKYIAFSYIILVQMSLWAQSKTIHGTVFNLETKSTIELCSVFNPVENTGVITSIDGKFTINIQHIHQTPYLIFESLGYERDTIQILPNRDNYEVFLQPQNYELDIVVVSGVTRATSIRENPVPITAISTQQIEASTESNIIDALVKNATGLTAVKTGPNISKPFIHGLGYNRILTLYDGIRQEGQQYGDEHGLEVDGYNIEKAEVLKGPASLLYGSDALAGVISLFPNIPNQQDGIIHGKFMTEFHTNNSMIGNGLRLGYSNKSFTFALRGSFRLAKNYRNSIDNRVYLTNFKEANLSALAGYKSNSGYTYLNFTLYDNHQGIPDGSRDSLTRRFTKQIFEGDEDDIKNRPVLSSEALNTYSIPDLSQFIQHLRAYIQSFYEMGKGEIYFTLGGQQNIRREYTHPSVPNQAGMYMRLNTLNYGLRYSAPVLHSIETSMGFNGMIQKNQHLDATDFPIPNYNLYDGGLYLYAKWKQSNWNISGGLRYDLRYIHWNDFFVGINTETGFEQQVSGINPGFPNLRFEAYSKMFQGVSGSLGLTFQASKAISLKFNIGRAYRSPNITEIGSNGLDPGAHIIYLGNRNFKPEFSLQEDLGIRLKFKKISAEANFFNNNIQNFIYLETVADQYGNPILDAQGNRTQQYQQARAQLYGYEVWFALHPEKTNGLSWENSMSVVFGFNRNSIYKNKGTKGAYLPLIPPLTIQSSLSYKIKYLQKRLISLSPKLELEYNGTQNRYLGLNATERATPSFALLHLGMHAEIKLKALQPIQIVFQIKNVFNKSYQSHLNRLKYFEYYNQSTNGHLGIYNMGRNIVSKIIIPF